jgi:hypothetical protein
MPSLTVRSMAELLRLPAYQQQRILAEQKYPKQQPQSFRTPYYQPALTAFREYYRRNNDAAALDAAVGGLQKIKVDSRRANNLRVIESFKDSLIAKRSLIPTSNRRYDFGLGDVILKLSTDMQASQGDEDRFIYFNCRNAPIDAETARLTLEIASLVLEANNIEFAISDIEFIDLKAGKLHKVSKRRSATTKLVNANAKIIATLWPTL